MHCYFVINTRNPGAFVALNPGYSLSRAIPKAKRAQAQVITRRVGAMFATPYLSEAERFIENAPPGVLREMLEGEV